MSDGVHIQFSGEESNLALGWKLPVDSIYGAKVIQCNPLGEFTWEEPEVDVWDFIDEVEKILQDLNEKLDG